MMIIMIMTKTNIIINYSSRLELVPSPGSGTGTYRRHENLAFFLTELRVWLEEEYTDSNGELIVPHFCMDSVG